MFGTNALRKQYELRIAELTRQFEARVKQYEGQISDLRKMVFSQTNAMLIPPIAREADKIITVDEEVVIIDRVEADELRKQQYEFDRVVSGDYEDINE